MPILLPGLLPIVPGTAQTAAWTTKQPSASEAASVPVLRAHSRHVPVPNLSEPVPGARADPPAPADPALAPRLPDVRLFKSGPGVVPEPIPVPGPKKRRGVPNG